jgi:hypothetical protein
VGLVAAAGLVIFNTGGWGTEELRVAVFLASPFLARTGSLAEGMGNSNQGFGKPFCMTQERLLHTVQLFLIR